MAKITKEQDFKNQLRIILDTIQLLKYNASAWKTNPIHEEVSKEKDMRGATADLVRALDAFLLKAKQRVTAETFRELMKVMSRDQLHDVSLHLDLVYGIENIADITKLLKDELKMQQAPIE